jgi:two-component system cell cycle response regulator
MSEYRYCDQFGLDKPARRARLEMLGLSDADQKIASVLSRSVIAPRVDEIVHRFYEHLFKYPAYSQILNRGYDVGKLRKTQTVYMLSLGQDFASAEYFEERLRVGLAHARIGLPLYLYECAYNTLTQLTLHAVPEEIRSDPGLHAQLVSFLFRITSLDMSLAIETYHLEKINALEETLSTLQLEEEELRYKIATDSLTEVASHSQALSVLEQAIRLAKRTSEPLCVCMVDLDHFKRINDTNGHLVGDAVLRDVAARMEAAVRSFDTIGRYGREEFVIILENTPLETAHEVAERVRKRVGDSPINVSGTSVSVTLSAGIAQLRPGDTIASIIGRADVAMYEAKSSGRDRIVIDATSA